MMSPIRCRERTALVLLPLLFVAACDTGPADSLYDPGREALPTPVITSVDPTGAALAGVDVITITGQNFVSDPAGNLVYFGDERATVLSASPTALQVVSPASPAESVGIRVAVVGETAGSEDFSESFAYRLDPAFVKFGGIGRVEEPTAIATDASGTLYMALFSGGVSVGFKTIAPDGTRSDYAASTFLWSAIAIGPDGLLYAVRNIRAVFRFAEGGSQEVFKALTPTSLRLAAITFDSHGNLWTGGESAELIRLAPDGTDSRYAFDADVKALRLYQGYLYAVAATADGYGVWRFAVDANDDLGAAERFFDITAELGAGVASEALAFAEDGTMFLGTDRADPVEVVHPDGSHEILYPGVLVQPDVGGAQIPPSAVLDFAWGPDPYLYMIRERPAGDLGPDALTMIRINTRKNGAG